MSVRIQKFEAIEDLTKVADDVFDGPVQTEYAAAFLASSTHSMFLASDNGLVVGMISGVDYFHPDKPRQLWINELGVAGRWRRRGIARRLIEALLADARERGCTSAWVATEPDNEAARRCYLSIAGGKPHQDAVFYEWVFDTGA